MNSESSFQAEKSNTNGSKAGLDSGPGPEAEAGDTASASKGMFLAYLLEVVGIQEDPTELNNLGGILGHVNTVLVAGGRNVNDHVAVHLERRTLLGRHDGRGGTRGPGEWTGRRAERRRMGRRR